MFTITEQIFNATKTHADWFLLIDYEKDMSLEKDITQLLISLYVIFVVLFVFMPLIPRTVLEHFGYHPVAWDKLNDIVSTNYYFGWMAKYSNEAAFVTFSLKIASVVIFVDGTRIMTKGPEYYQYQRECGAISVIVCVSTTFFAIRKMVELSLDIGKFLHAAVFNVVGLVFASVAVRLMLWEIQNLPIRIGAMKRDTSAEIAMLIIFVCWAIHAFVSVWYYALVYRCTEVREVHVDEAKKHQ